MKPLSRRDLPLVELLGSSRLALLSVAKLKLCAFWIRVIDLSTCCRKSFAKKSRD